ncbi:transcription factor IBH1-like 1 isoform X2 [Carica papaya]|nr:transcription factor IBH1-like 1 isoform X2 [Carica papaya]
MMKVPSSFKKEFLKKWIVGLQVCGSLNKNMSVSERKKAIKLSADIAMASARNGSTCWSRALIANASKQDANKLVVEHVLGDDESRKLTKQLPVGTSMALARKIRVIRSKKNILKRRSGPMRRAARKSNSSLSSSCIAKRLVRKRSQVLKSLVPGGEFMDETSLIEETLDYILSLRAQVDVMLKLANATELVTNQK